MSDRNSLYLLCRAGWTWAHSDLPASASPSLELKACATMLRSLFLSLLSVYIDIFNLCHWILDIMKVTWFLCSTFSSHQTLGICWFHWPLLLRKYIWLPSNLLYSVINTSRFFLVKELNANAHVPHLWSLLSHNLLKVTSEDKYL